MKGVIFAAGLGTRLYPLTKDRPKALVSVAGCTMLEHTLLKFEEAGINEVVVNVHAFADKVETELNAWAIKYPTMTIRVSDERDLLLETGGGLKKMQSWLEGEPFLVHNVDVLTDIDLVSLVDADKQYDQHLATLAVRKTESDRYFLFNDQGLLCGWENVKTGEKKISRPEETSLHRFGFTGIHLIHPELFNLMSETGVFSITEVYLRLAAQHDIRLFDVSDRKWFDIGTPEQLQAAEADWK
jgi:NDP-sugar pyrophosphorylase family protein